MGGISSLKDRALTSNVMYVELLKAVRPEEGDLNLVHYDVKPLVSGKVMDKQRDKRTENARYCMSLVRRFGVELFLNASQLNAMDSKAIFELFAAIMTLSMRQSQK